MCLITPKNEVNIYNVYFFGCQEERIPKLAYLPWLACMKRTEDMGRCCCYITVDNDKNGVIAK